MSEEKNNNVEKVIKTATESLKSISGGKVTGEVINNLKGQKVVPVSDMTVAVFSGGGEYGKVKTNNHPDGNFAGGCAVICSLRPNNFIIDNGNGFEIKRAESLFENISDISSAFIKAFKK